MVTAPAKQHTPVASLVDIDSVRYPFGLGRFKIFESACVRNIPCPFVPFAILILPAV